MKRLLKLLFIKLPLAFIALSLALVLLFKWVPVKYTPLMLRRELAFSGDGDYTFSRRWMPLEEISPNLRKAVIAGEDNLFAEHHGFDVNELEKMMEAHRKKGKKIRGCSTISQQTAKNVFTFGTSCWARKAVESWFTVLIEAVWGKRRILEVYLNVVEMGKGVYGAEAASQRYFKRPASKLSASQAALIAAALPSPLKRNPARPSSYMRKRSAQIVSLTGKLAYPDWVKRTRPETDSKK